MAVMRNDSARPSQPVAPPPAANHTRPAAGLLSCTAHCARQSRPALFQIAPHLPHLTLHCSGTGLHLLDGMHEIQGGGVLKFSSSTTMTVDSLFKRPWLCVA